MNTLTALKRSTLGLDLYLWLVYRTFTLRAPLRLTWRLLYCQFGAHPDKASDNQTVQHFLNQIARWANTYKENAEALEVVTHLVAIERALDTLTVEGEPR